MSTPFKLRFKLTLVALGALFCWVPLLAQNEAPQVLIPLPEPFSMQNSTTVTISVMFDRAMDGSSITPQSFVVNGKKTGIHSTGTLSYSPVSQKATYETSTPFQAGEMVTVTLTRAILGDNGTALAASYQWSFYIQATTGTAQFTLNSTYATSEGPHFVGIGELNNDAKLDLAVPHSRSDDVIVWLNSGTGIFSRTDTIVVDPRPRVLTNGDFDSDGDQDIAAVSEDTGELWILDNDGNGNFTARDTTFTVGVSPLAISNGDLNGDGFLDLVTVNLDANSVSVLLNLGDGNFQNETQFAVGQNPQAVFIADFNNDGFLDVVVTNDGDDTISLLLNDGTASFATEKTFNAGNGPSAIWAQDFNNDRKIDLVVANRGDNTISVLINIGAGGNFSGPSNFATGTDPMAVTSGDFDGDLDADLAVVNRLSNNMNIFFNNGVGFFEKDTTNYATETQPRGINSADLNGDGVLDLAVVNWTSHSLQVFFNAFRQPENQAPSAPALLSPADLIFLNPDSAQVFLNWSVPNDFEGDLLHFVVEIAQNSNFVSPFRILDSRVHSGFSPVPPVDQNTGSIMLTLIPPIPDGDYWWRVSAWDGDKFGVPSEPRRFKIDSTLPIIDEMVMTDPDLAPNWYNQNTTASINFGVQYDEVNASQAVFEFGILGQETRSIVSGNDQIVQAPINLAGAVDSTYTLTVTISDSVGNQTKTDTEIALDGTPPSGTSANSPGLSSATDFTVNWGLNTSDGDGTGVAGFDVRVQVNGGEWQSWQTNVEDTSAVYVGANGRTYGFEAVAFDSIGNRETFSNTAQTETVVDTTADDVTAPGPPLSLTAAGSNPSPWQNNPGFQTNWQPPTDPSGIGRAFYKLGTSPVSNNDFDSTVSGASSVMVTADQENGQNFYLWFEDQKGNVDFNNFGFVQLLYDSTAPDIVEIEILNANQLPNWFNQGITDTAEVEINYDELHLKQIQLTSTELDTTINIEQPEIGIDILLPFNLVIQGKTDGLYALHFTLIDSAGNISRDSTNFNLDNSPPVDTKTQSVDTTRSESFSVSWDGTGNDGNGSGLAGVYDLQYQVNGGAWQAWHSNFSGTSDTFDGTNGQTYGFEVAAYDILGNREAFNDTSESKTVVDIEFVDVNPPTVFHTSQLLVDEGQDVTIDTKIEDDHQITEVLLFYKNSGDVSFQSAQMTNVGSDSFRYTITADKISIMGLNYFIQASDGVNFSYHPAANWDTVPNNISVRIVGTASAGLIRTKSQPAGTEQFFFRMISVPLILENKSPLAVLEDDLGAYDPKKWRLYQFKSNIQDYSEYPDIDSFDPGKAFWLIVREPNITIDSGIGSTVVTNQPFGITLSAGWNDFGLPFPFSVNWSDVMVVQGEADSIMGPYTFQDEWLLPNQISVLSPWEGYSIYSKIAGIRIEILPIVSASQQAESLFKTGSEPDWQLGITAVCGNAHDSYNYLGVAASALNEWDKLDYLEPPYIADFVSITFPHDNWQSYQGAFTTDFRTPFVDGQVWHFEVETSIKNKPVTLKFESLETLPVNFRAILLDKSTYQQKQIDSNTEYVFIPDQKSVKREFELVIGTMHFIENSETLKEIVPKSFFLSQNYPNPFNAGTNFTYHVSSPGHVSIQVLNILGQEVRELISEKHVPGIYRVHWDGTSDNGKEISTGVYIIKFEAENFQQIRKVILVR